MVTEFNRENHVKNLPDAFRKDESSNNRKILDIEKSATDRLREAISGIYDSLDIDKATGKTLDMYGEMYGQIRGGQDDDKYRLSIKHRIAMNTADCDHNSIVSALALALGFTPDRFHFEEIVGGVVNVDKFPYDSLQEAGFTLPQAWRMIEDLLPAGVRIAGFNITHEIEDAVLRVASAVTFAETHVCESSCDFYESLETDRISAASAVTHNENYFMEVQTTNERMD